MRWLKTLCLAAMLTLAARAAAADAAPQFDMPDTPAGHMAVIFGSLICIGMIIAIATAKRVGIRLLAVVVLVLTFLGLASVMCGPRMWYSLELSPQQLVLDQKGAAAKVAVTRKDANGKVVPLEGTVTWTSSNEKVAKVANGVVTAEDSGSCTITAADGKLEATAKATVQIPKAIVIDPTEIELAVGDRKALTAKIVDTAGKEIVGKPIDWKTDNAAVATVVGNEAIGKRSGNCKLTATWGNLSATMSVVVAKSTSKQTGK